MRTGAENRKSLSVNIMNYYFCPNQTIVLLLFLRVGTYDENYDFDPQSQIQSLLDQTFCQYFLEFGA
jgi:hypothetical protein